MSLPWHGGAFVGALALSLAWMAAPRPAEACGGTFCDAGPASMPVDQSGENILFILDGEEIEVHIQIQYQGDPAKFGWVIPLTAVPEFSIGSEALFQSLLAGTVPTYGFTTVRDQCPVPAGNGISLDDSQGVGGDEGGGDTNGAPTDPGGPQVVLRQTLGAYEIAVLEGGTADEVIAWLDTNGYQQDPDAAPILAEYLSEGLLFGAIKLIGGADVDQIHPIVLRMRSNEPCVPLRLTRIAALEDMEVRTFFLGDERMVPSNYRHVLVNPLKLDWLQLAANYKEVIIGAVDAEHADGRAFVTEYAGRSNVVSPGGLHSPDWAPDAFRPLAPAALSAELQDQGLVSCNEWEGCQLLHPLVGGLLTEFLPLPEGTAIEELLACPECFPEITTWDADGFADAFAERVVAPGEHAEALLAQWPYVTRMYTTISPHEMTRDPIFHARGDLGDVTNSQQATRRIMCNGDMLFTLPDRREVFIPNGGTWPEFPEQMPWEEEVTELPLAGAPMTLSDRTDEIDELLAAYNASVGWSTVGCEGCTVDDPSTRGRWALGAVVLLLGAGLLRRRRWS
jgi:MYXO-CTERM domain-containing protein